MPFPPRHSAAVAGVILPAAAAPAAWAQALVAPETLPHDLSPLGMFRQADIVVQAVMLGLAFASVVTWTVLVVKLIEFALASAALRRGAGRIEAADTLRSLVDQIELTPVDGKVEIAVQGDLAGILTISTQSKNPAAGATGSQVKMVAGAGFEPATFRL